VMSETLPYGAWRSPITSELIVGETLGLGDIRVDGRDIYWVEGRPSEGGRNVLVRRVIDVNEWRRRDRGHHAGAL